MRSPRLLRFHPREFWNRLEIVLFDTPIEEVFQIGLNPFDGVWRKAPFAGVLREVFNQVVDQRCVQISKRLPPKEWLTAFKEQQTIVNGLSLSIPTEPLCVSLYGLCNLTRIEVSPSEDLDQSSVVKVISELVGFMFIRRPCRTINVPLHSRHSNPTHPCRLLIIPSDEEVDGPILERTRFEDRF